MKKGRIDAFMHKLDWFVDIFVILNAIAILLTTDKFIFSKFSNYFDLFFLISSWIFIIEIIIRIFYLKLDFWKGYWNIFDLIVTLVSSICFLPSLMSLRMLRLFRMVRVFRLFSINAPLRKLTQSLVVALPRVLWTSIFLLSLFCVYATIGIDLYGEKHPEYFGSIGSTFFSLFQIMTLESWATGVARNIMATNDYAWLYFVSFILISTYILLNLLFGVITSATIEVYEAEERKDANEELKKELNYIKNQLSRLENMIKNKAE